MREHIDNFAARHPQPSHRHNGNRVVRAIHSPARPTRPAEPAHPGRSPEAQREFATNRLH
jgi:hypothetical protein